jgi:xanthine dehydrogenase YagS FAD-binding subunit
MNVALSALEAVIHIQGPGGERKVAIDDFFVLPGSTPHVENVLQPGDLITHVTVKPLPAGANSTYLKLRDRASYEFALASAAVIVKRDGDKITHVRVALGGVGAKPWRALAAEKSLHGSSVSPENFRKAAEDELRTAKAQSHNGFKIELSKRCLSHALKLATT